VGPLRRWLTMSLKETSIVSILGRSPDKTDSSLHILSKEEYPGGFRSAEDGGLESKAEAFRQIEANLSREVHHRAEHRPPTSSGYAISKHA